MPRNAATNRLAIRDYPASLSFNGTSSRVDANYISGLPTAGTVILRFKARSLGKQLINNSNGSSDRWCISIGSDGTLRAMYFTGAANAPRSTAIGSIQLNQWYQGGYSYNSSGTVGRIYLNGVVANSGTQQPGTTAGTTFNIGSRGGADFFDGLISEVLAWNRVLTDQEVSDLYFNGIIPTGSIAINLPFTEGAGSTANDISGNGNNGTITSGTFSVDSPMKARKASVNANMVKNGDFEYAPPFTAATTTAGRYIDGTVSGSTTNTLFGAWAVVSGAITASASASFDTSVFYSGSKSMKLSTLDATGAVVVANTLSTASPATSDVLFPLTPNTSYTLTFRCKTNNVATNSAFIFLREYTQALGTVATNNSTKLSGTNDWTLITLSFTTGSTTRFGAVAMCNNVAGNISDAWFDDISLTPVYPEGRVPVDGNLVKNFDFEIAPSGGIATTTQSRWPDGTAGGSTTNATYKWKCQSGSNNTSVLFDPTVSHSGSYSLKLSALDTLGSFYVDIGAGIASTQPVETLKSFAIPVAGGISYTLIGWIKTNNVPTNGAFLQLTTYDSAGTRLDNVGSSVKLTGTQDWTQITIAQAINARAAWATIGLMKNVAGNVSDAWFDDIYFAPTTNPGRVVIT